VDENHGKPGELGNPDKGVYEPHIDYISENELAVFYASEKHVTEEIPYSLIIAEKFPQIMARHGRKALARQYPNM